MTGLQLAPELPVEEAVFLTLLCYNTLLVWRFLDLRLRGRGRRDVPAVPAARAADGGTGPSAAGKASDGPTTGAGA